MTEVERLRELAAYYSRTAELMSRNDIRNWLVALAAETLERARVLERGIAPPVINFNVQQPARQQQQTPPKHDDPEKE